MTRRQSLEIFRREEISVESARAYLDKLIRQRDYLNEEIRIARSQLRKAEQLERGAIE